MDAIAVTADQTPLPPKQSIIKKAIIYGAVFDVAASFAYGFLISFIYALVGGRGTTLIFTDFNAQYLTHSLMGIIGTIFGTMISVMAGYVTARGAKHRPYAHALWAAGIVFAINFLPLFSTFMTYLHGTAEFTVRQFFLIAFTPFVFPTYLLGAWVYQFIESQHEATA